MTGIIVVCAVGAIVILVVVMIARHKNKKPKTTTIEREAAFFLPSNIQFLRLKSGLSRAALSEALSLKIETYLMIESTQCQQLTFEVVQKIAEYFHIPAVDLLYRDLAVEYVENSQSTKLSDEQFKIVHSFPTSPFSRIEDKR